MKELLKIIRRFARPYYKYLGSAVVINIFSAIFNIFSFTLIIPVLKIIFSLDPSAYVFMPWDSVADFKQILLNNVYYYVSQLVLRVGGSNTLIILGVFLGVTTLLKTSCYFGASAIMIPLRTGIVKDIRTQVYDKMLSLPMGFYSSQRKGDIIARMTGDVNEIEYSITSVLDMLIKNPILIVFYFGTLLFTSWELTLFTITVVPVMAWGMGVIGRKLRRQSLDAQQKFSSIISQIEETLGGLRVIKAFIAEDKMRSRFNSTSESHRRSAARVSTRQALAHPLSEFLGTMMIMIVLWFGGTLILSDRASIDAPTFIFYIAILYSVLAPIKELAKASYMIPRGLASMERVDAILKAENDIKEKADAITDPKFDNQIEIRDLTFCYNEGVEVLKDINLTVRKGQRIALVGQSGSGKTTLVDLIPRYWDAGKGGILIDGVDIRNMSLKGLRHLIGNVNQEAILFNDTIFNNIAFGVEGATMDQVVAAAKIANAHDFIMEKEDGYQTNIGDRGCLLSGGQRQRISIARAILKNPQILILDEATSALDTESEKLVQEALDRLTESRTTIAIAHRLSTIKNSDLICVLQDGRIVERGTHEELISRDGVYTKLYHMQSL